MRSPSLALLPMNLLADRTPFGFVKGMPHLPGRTRDAHRGFVCAWPTCQAGTLVGPTVGPVHPPFVSPRVALEQRQVFLRLPVAHALVEVFPLALLHVAEVIDVVLTPSWSETLPEHLVLAQVPHRVQEVPGKDLDAAAFQLSLRHLVHVPLVRFAGVELVVDPVETRREYHGRGQIWVGRPVDRAVFEPTGCGRADH